MGRSTRRVPAQVGEAPGGVRLRPNSGFPRRTHPQRDPPVSQSFGRPRYAAIAVRQKRVTRKFNILFARREGLNNSNENFGDDFVGRGQTGNPAQPGLCPTYAGTSDGNPPLESETTIPNFELGSELITTLEWGPSFISGSQQVL
jgi:hypothetical protein